MSLSSNSTEAEGAPHLAGAYMSLGRTRGEAQALAINVIAVMAALVSPLPSSHMIVAQSKSSSCCVHGVYTPPHALHYKKGGFVMIIRKILT